MVYKLEYAKEATKFLKKLSSELRGLMLKKLTNLADNPTAYNNNIKALTNSPYYRLRVGDYRIIYEIINDKMIIKVIKIGHRQEVYRWN